MAGSSRPFLGCRFACSNCGDVSATLRRRLNSRRAALDDYTHYHTLVSWRSGCTAFPCAMAGPAARALPASIASGDPAPRLAPSVQAASTSQQCLLAPRFCASQTGARHRRFVAATAAKQPKDGAGKLPFVQPDVLPPPATGSQYQPDSFWSRAFNGGGEGDGGGDRSGGRGRGSGGGGGGGGNRRRRGGGDSGDEGTLVLKLAMMACDTRRAKLPCKQVNTPCAASALGHTQPKLAPLLKAPETFRMLCLHYLVALR